MATPVTVFSDASFKDGKSAHHFWWKSELQTMSGQGIVEHSPSVCYAELRGILEGVKSAAIWHKANQINDLVYIIQCDATQALGTLISYAKAKVAKTSPLKFLPNPTKEIEQKNIAEAIYHWASGAQIYLKHVRGHTSHKDVRHALNRFNDKKAKETYKLAFTK